MVHDITLIPGDGIGPEITKATTRVLEATGVRFDWDPVNAGAGVVAEYGTPLPDNVLASIKKNRVALKGPVTTPIGSGFRSVNVALRQQLELYACLRPCKSYAGIQTPYQGVDIVIVRENTEDLYAGIEFEKGAPETARLIEFISRAAKRTSGPIRASPSSRYRRLPPGASSATPSTTPALADAGKLPPSTRPTS